MFSAIQPRLRNAANHQIRSGFTLVELLVSVGLVLLMMVLFAEIFQIAGSSVTQQRGIAENDRRSRSIQTVLEQDLRNRTFRYVVPWSVGEDANLEECSANLRQGYLYISENDPDNGLDDVLQLTVDLSSSPNPSNDNRFFGQAELLTGAAITTHPNQPEFDDGWTSANDVGFSRAAEVAYFVRNGRLYRRVLLLRDPPSIPGGTTTQPTFNDGRNAFDPSATGTPSPYSATGPFWRDFDYSAFPLTAPLATTVHARFHGVSDLNNGAGASYFALGKPQYRFGHSSVYNNAAPDPLRVVNPRPREFDGNGTFMGRFTHEETSNTDFRYPQAATAGGIDPMDTTDTTLVLGTDPTLTDFQVITAFDGGSRRGEDLVLSNVHEFDVKILDDGANSNLGAFVDIGGTGSVDYAMGARLNTDYGPTSAAADNRVFDTWYPFPAGNADDTREVDLDADDANDPPPFHPFRVTSTSTPAFTAWAASTAYSLGDYVVPTAANRRSNGFRYVYLCVGAGTSGATEPSRSAWPNTPGQSINDGGVTWQSVDNWKPLKAIQIRLRYFDETSQQMRQQTIIHSLVDQ